MTGDSGSSRGWDRVLQRGQGEFILEFIPPLFPQLCLYFIVVYCVLLTTIPALQQLPGEGRAESRANPAPGAAAPTILCFGTGMARRARGQGCAVQGTWGHF